MASLPEKSLIFCLGDLYAATAGEALALRQLPDELPAQMARRDLLHKDHFSVVFGGAKTQSYTDPSAKGPGSHT